MTKRNRDFKRRQLKKLPGSYRGHHDCAADLRQLVAQLQEALQESREQVALLNAEITHQKEIVEDLHGIISAKNKRIAELADRLRALEAKNSGDRAPLFPGFVEPLVNHARNARANRRGER
jgi:chromosome segregation ATPase